MTDFKWLHHTVSTLGNRYPLDNYSATNLSQYSWVCYECLLAICGFYIESTSAHLALFTWILDGGQDPIQQHWQLETASKRVSSAFAVVCAGISNSQIYWESQRPGKSPDRSAEPRACLDLLVSLSWVIRTNQDRGLPNQRQRRSYNKRAMWLKLSIELLFLVSQVKPLHHWNQHRRTSTHSIWTQSRCVRISLLDESTWILTISYTGGLLPWLLLSSAGLLGDQSNDTDVQFCSINSIMPLESVVAVHRSTSDANATPLS